MPCELHIWPASEIKGYGGGAISPMAYGGGLLGVLLASETSQRDDHKPPTVAVLTPDHQLEILEAANLPRLLGTPAAVVVRHAKPIPRMDITAIRERHAASASPCYSEVIVSQIFFDRAPMAIAELRMLLVYRQFGASQTVESSFSTWAGSELTSFPPKTEADLAAAEADLVRAYRSNVQSFAGYAVAPRPAKKKKR